MRVFHRPFTHNLAHTFVQALRLPDDDNAYLQHSSAAHQLYRHRTKEHLMEHPEWQRLLQWRQAYEVTSHGVATPYTRAPRHACRLYKLITPIPRHAFDLQAGHAAAGAAFAGRIPHDLIHHLVAADPHDPTDEMPMDGVDL